MCVCIYICTCICIYMYICNIWKYTVYIIINTIYICFIYIYFFSQLPPASDQVAGLNICTPPLLGEMEPQLSAVWVSWMRQIIVLHLLAGHYGKDAYRSGGPDLHNFISSGFVTLGRGHTKGTVETIFY